MALDYGRARIGVAVSDPTRTIASPHGWVPATEEPAGVPEALLSLLDGLDPAVLLVGVPLNMDGSEGEIAREARSFARELARTTGLPVVEWDERLSSEGARRAMRRSGASRRSRRQRGAEDAVAASLLLRAWLASPEGRTEG